MRFQIERNLQSSAGRWPSARKWAARNAITVGRIRQILAEVIDGELTADRAAELREIGVQAMARGGRPLRDALKARISNGQFKRHLLDQIWAGLGKDANGDASSPD